MMFEEAHKDDVPSICVNSQMFGEAHKDDVPSIYVDSQMFNDQSILQKHTTPPIIQQSGRTTRTNSIYSEDMRGTM